MQIDKIENLLRDNIKKFELMFCDDINIIKSNLNKQFEMIFFVYAHYR